jgi:hypothetical protein
LCPQLTASEAARHSFNRNTARTGFPGRAGCKAIEEEFAKKPPLECGKENNVKRLWVLLVILLGAGLVSCGKRYVGQRIDPGWPGWCHYLSGEKHCTKTVGALVFDFTIKEGQGEGTFIIEGVVDATKGEIKSWDKMLEGKSRFSMIVSDDGIIVDNVAFRPRSAYGDLGQQMPFLIHYSRPEGFDAVTFSWNMVIRG